MGKDSEVLREALKDRKDNLAAAHARAIATFRLSGPGKAANSALWDAFSAGPEIPFYILGFMPEPGNGSDEEDEAYNFAVPLRGRMVIGQQACKMAKPGCHSSRPHRVHVS